ncbi:unnamed protein product [Discosporangium mesarthrocarpum]
MAPYLVTVNAVSFFLYAVDKALAKGSGLGFQRVPENVLHFVDLCGGTVGAFAAQRIFSHKISKLSYLHIFLRTNMAHTCGCFLWGFSLGWTLGVVGRGLASLVMAGATIMRIKLVATASQRNPRGYRAKRTRARVRG